MRRQLLPCRPPLAVRVSRLGVRLALRGRALRLLRLRLFGGVLAALDAGPLLALAAAAVRRRGSRAQRQLFQFFVLLALGLGAGLAVVQRVLKAHLVQQRAVGVHAPNVLALIGPGFAHKRMDGVNVGAAVRPRVADGAAAPTASISRQPRTMRRTG